MKKDLTKYDFILAIDKSGSMSQPGTRGKSRWQELQETTLAVATKAAEFDDDGIAVVVFNNNVKIYDNVTPAKVTQVFAENDPIGGTDTALMLKTVFASYNKKKPTILVVITDGEPNSELAVKESIRDFANTLNNREEFGILFLQIGDDKRAQLFLKELDDNLNAKLDIVSAMTFNELENITLTEAFIRALEN